MKMFSAGVGIGAGIKDFRRVFIFSTKEAFDSFVEQGWQAGAQADAVAKAGEKGGAADSAIDVGPRRGIVSIHEKWPGLTSYHPGNPILEG